MGDLAATIRCRLFSAVFLGMGWGRAGVRAGWGREGFKLLEVNIIDRLA